MTRPSPKPSTLTADPRRAVERARDFLRAAAAGPRTLAAYLDAGAVEDTALFYATDGFGAAQKLLLDLLSVVDELAPAQSATGTAGGTPITAPHSYIPDGPIETAPLAGYCRPEIRREAFAAVLEGVRE